MSERIISVVAALIRDDEGRVLLVRKRGTAAFMQPGGKRNAGESDVAALSREIVEELGCRVIENSARPLGVFDCVAANEPGWKVRAAVYSVVVDGGVVPKAEIDEVVWVDPARARDLQLAPLTRDHVLPLAVAEKVGGADAAQQPADDRSWRTIRRSLDCSHRMTTSSGVRSMQIMKGGCHCGRVRFQVTADLDRVTECNCSICSKKGFLHLVVPPEQFELLRGKDDLTTYQFNTKTAKHTFCKVCGIHPFYVPRSDPDKIDVNVRCLDDIDIAALSVKGFDGKHWESAMQKRVPWR